MTQIGDVERIARSRKAKRCCWCDEMIGVGQPAIRWLWKDGADIGAVRVHPECYAALQRRDLWDGEEWCPGEFSRGCCCEHGACECRRAQPA